MTIKKTILALTLALGSVVVYGQNVDRKVKETANTLFNKHLYMQLQGGMAHTVGETKFTDLLSPSASLHIGYQFSPGFGVRIGATGWQAKGALVSPNELYKWNYLQGSADLIWNIVNSFNYNPHRTVSPYLFAGGGAAMGFKNIEAQKLDKSKLPLLWSSKKLFWIARAGLGIDIRVSDHISLMLEGNVNMLPDNFNSKVGDVLDFQANALAGIKINLGKSYTRTEPVYYEPISIAKPEEPEVKEPEDAPTVKTEATTTLRKFPNLPSIHFEFDSDKIDEVKYEAELSEIVSILQEFKETKVNIIGFTDHAGSNQYNDALSMRRAIAVKNYLISKGITADRMNVTGMGKDPKVDGEKAFTIQARRVDVQND